MIRADTAALTPVFLTQTEAADYLRLSPRTLERWRIEGNGPVYRKFGRRVVYARIDLEHWADGLSLASTSSKQAS